MCFIPSKWNATCIQCNDVTKLLIVHAVTLAVRWRKQAAPDQDCAVLEVTALLMEVCSEHCAFISNGTVSMASKANRTQILCFGQNVTAPKDQLQEADMPYKILVAVLASLLALIILVGNGLIIVSVMMVKKLRQPANYLIVSLALSDFLVALVVLPLTIVYDILGEWVFGSTICNIHVSFDVICCTTSIMNLCMISIDR